MLCQHWHLKEAFEQMQYRDCISALLYKALRPYKHTGILVRSILSTLAQWLSGRVLDSRPRGGGFEPHQCHWDVVLEQDTFILA